MCLLCVCFFVCLFILLPPKTRHAHLSNAHSVHKVAAGGVAARAGVTPGQAIVAVGDKNVRFAMHDEVVHLIKAKRAEGSVAITFQVGCVCSTSVCHAFSVRVFNILSFFSFFFS